METALATLAGDRCGSPRRFRATGPRVSAAPALGAVPDRPPRHRASETLSVGHLLTPQLHECGCGARLLLPRFRRDGTMDGGADDDSLADPAGRRTRGMGVRQSPQGACRRILGASERTRRLSLLARSMRATAAAFCFARTARAVPRSSWLAAWTSFTSRRPTVASCTKFVSADDRQLAVAKASGLEAVDIKRRVRRKRS